MKMKINVAMEHAESHFIDWFLKRHWLGRCFLVSVGIPLLLLAMVSLCASPVLVGCMLMGML